MLLPKQPDEPLRLEALKAVGRMVQVPDPSLDRVTSLAQKHFRVPIALIAFVDDERVYALSRQGVDASVPREARLGQAISPLVISEREPVVVSDARADPRMRESLYVQGPPYVRFFAGAPLLYEGNLSLGSLSVADLKPRTFSRGDRAELMMLADFVVSVLSHRTQGLPEPELTDTML
jgi:GAF domain-containing protein